jgi:hypothetical protein
MPKQADLFKVILDAIANSSAGKKISIAEGGELARDIRDALKRNQLLPKAKK